MQPTTPTTEGPQEHVLTASGEFDVHDEPIDLGIYRFEDWISFGFFWLLAGTVFLQFFTRYALNDSAGWTEEIARYLLICTVFIGAAVSVRKNNHIHVDFFYRDPAEAADARDVDARRRRAHRVLRLRDLAHVSR